MTKVYFSVDGQNDNIGDSILRRGLLRSFQGLRGAELHVCIGPRVDGRPGTHRGAGNDARYLSAVGLDGSETTYTSIGAWHRSAAWNLVRGAVVLVQHAGERYFPSPRPWTGWRSLVGAVAVRARGGAMVQVGASAQVSVERAPWAERQACRQAALVRWRDAPTREVFGVGGTMPDFAYAEGPDPGTSGLGEPPASRPLLAVSVRGDREPLGEQRRAQLRAIAVQHGLEVQVFTQVRRDAEGAVALAADLHPGRPAVIFGEESHDVWERRVRELFRRSAIVASDRAHGVIIGATEGAIPLPIAASRPVKAARLLRVAGFDAPDEAGPATDDYLSRMLADPSAVEDRVAAARAEVEDVRAELAGLVTR